MYVMLIDDLRAVRRIPVATSWRLDVRLELPISQGFGMSAAGFLAAARAVLDANGTPDDRYAARVAHRMERCTEVDLGTCWRFRQGAWRSDESRERQTWAVQRRVPSLRPLFFGLAA